MICRGEGGPSNEDEGLPEPAADDDVGGDDIARGDIGVWNWSASPPSPGPRLLSTHAPTRGSHSRLSRENSWGASRKSRAKSPESLGMKYPMNSPSIARMFT